jgi:hypothetical protein
MRSRVGVVSLFVIAALAGCGEHHLRSTTSAPAGRATGSTSRPITAAARCPVTLPRPWVPPPDVSQRALFGSDSAFGNGRLWVGGLWPSGVIQAGPRFINKDGSVGMKFGWWRNVRGHLRITGRRLDAHAPPLRAEFSDYGMTGFQASGVIFPTGGCWQVTGKAGTATLTFVTMVIKQAI